jgi:DNA adenine methylase
MSIVSTEAKPSRPIVRYHGGKWRLAPWIISRFPAHRVYTETFGGGGSVLLRKKRSYAEVYNDLDGEIVNLFRVVRDHGEQLVRAVELTPFARAEFELSYEPSPDPIEQARRTLVRCGMGFGSSAMNTDNKTGFRGSATRSGTTPATDWRNQNRNLWDVIDRLRGVVIENRPAIEIIQYHDAPTTLHYVDPPYVHDTRTWLGGKEAYRHEMTDAQHEELADVLHSLKGIVILSGYPSALYDRLYSDWACETREALADAAAKRIECLWINPAAVEHKRSLFMEPTPCP